jgi:hypothetical protein
MSYEGGHGDMHTTSRIQHSCTETVYAWNAFLSKKEAEVNSILKAGLVDIKAGL